MPQNRVVPRRLRVAAALVLSSALMVFTRAAAPAGPSTRLQYSRGDETSQCPGEQELRDSVAARLGYDPFARDASPLIVTSVAEKDGVLHGTVEYRDETGAVRGQRELQSMERDCKELAEAMALTIVLLLDPRSALGSAPKPDILPPQKPKAPAPKRPPEPALPVAPTTRPPEEQANPVGFRAGIGGLGSIGAAPAPALGLEIVVGLVSTAWAVDVEGRLDLPASTTTDAGYGVRSSVLLATLAPCYRHDWLRACALLSLGSLSGEGVAVERSHHKEAFHAAAGVRFALELPITERLGFRAHVDALAALTRTSLAVADVNVWTVPPLSGALGCGVIVRIR